MLDIKLFPKQDQFVRANNRVNLYVGGIQSGKTTSGALKMNVRGIMKFQSPEDNFIVGADTYKTLSQATMPKFLAMAKGLGKYNSQKAEFKTNWGSTVFFRTATDPESMEGIPNVRRIWIDELGKCSRYFWENAMGRAARLEAPIDGTTTPYAMNWLGEIVKEVQAGKRNDVSFINCRSIDSPYFPKTEYERQRGLLSPKRFAMKYDGIFGQMEGLVYESMNLCPSFPMPTGTRYYAGIDWGYYPDPFCVVIRALTPDKKHYRINEYYKNHLTISDIIRVVKGFHSLYKFEMTYCDPSQPAHIEELNRNGIPAMGANNDIRFGIDKHYELIKTERFWIFEDFNPIGIDEYNSYHYPEEKELKIDESLKESSTNPVDQDNHGCDADRYVSVEVEKVITERREPKSHYDTLGSAPREDLAKRIQYLQKRRIKVAE